MFPWRFWGATAAIAVIFFGFTLTTAVPVWFDEALIVEYGRVTLASETPIDSFQLRSDSNRPMYSAAVLGGLIQELAFRATSPSNAGPRLAALLGQILAFGWFLYYLRLRGVSAGFSILLSLAFLIDPLCDISWRGSRIDGWAFAFLFAAMSAIRASRGRPRGDRSGRGMLVLGGAAAAAGLFCWQSFAMLLPLVVFELGGLAWQQRRYLEPLGLFAGGAAVTAALSIASFPTAFANGLADGALLTRLQSAGTWGTGS